MRAYTPDRVVRALARGVSIAYFGLLLFTAVVLIGLPIVKFADSGNPDWVIGLRVPVSIHENVTVVTRWGDAQLGLDDMRGLVRLPIGKLPWSLLAVLWTYLATAGALMLMFLHHLRRVLDRVQDGTPFDPANAPRLRWLGLLALGFAGITGVSEFVTSLAVRRTLISERVEVPPGFSVDGTVVFFGLVLLLLAEIFRRGAELEEAEALTL